MNITERIHNSVCRVAKFWYLSQLARFVRNPVCNIPGIQEAAGGRMAHNNGRNRANGMTSNTWKPCI
jgi:hypothetical protein